MPTFTVDLSEYTKKDLSNLSNIEVEIDDYDLEYEGWVHGDDVDHNDCINRDDLEFEGYYKTGEYLSPVEEYLFKNNPEITPAMKDILEIIGVEVWRMKSV